jgi:hypothetical protein
LQGSKIPFLMQQKPACGVWENQYLLLLDASCLDN